ncbi:MAG TPA: hypothetical protein VGO55_16820 [Allosphingosinicella sp.]|jgi:hypothetical protein|nr:hypothetical protein [Allosphingosinicella sp.]
MRNLGIVPLAVLALASAVGAPAAPAPSSAPRHGDIRLTPPERCRPGEPRVADFAGTVAAQRLDQLPAGNLDLAVMREVDGCPEPVTIREGYGAMGTRVSPTRTVRPSLPRAHLLGR